MEDEPTGQDVYWTQSVFDEWVAEDGVAEDVEHVVPVVGQRKGVDDGIQMDDKHRCNCCGDQQAYSTESWQLAGLDCVEDVDNCWQEEREREECCEGEKIKDLRSMNGSDVV